MRRKWRPPQEDSKGAQEIARELEIHPLLAQILLNRGIKSTPEARAFLSPSLQDLHQPLLLKDMEPAVSRLNLALSRHEKILLYGDYDVDGITGMALMWHLLRELGGHVIHYLPDRVREGYGLKEEVIHWAKGEGVGLILAIDQGINADREAALAGFGINPHRHAIMVVAWRMDDRSAFIWSAPCEYRVSADGFT